MSDIVEYSTPPNTMEPVGPYSHIAKVGDFITIGAVAGVDPATGRLVGPDITSQTLQTLEAFELRSHRSAPTSAMSITSTSFSRI